MNPNYYSDIAWTLNIILIAVVFVLVATGLLAAFAVNAASRRRLEGEASLKNLLQDVKGQDTHTLDQRFSELDKQATTEQWIEVVNEHETIIPEEVWPHLKRHLSSSARMVEIERLAGQPGNKWRRIEAMKCIGTLQTPSALGILEKSLSDKDQDVVYFAMLALARVRNAEAARILLGVLKRGVFSGQKIVSLLETFPPECLPEVYQALQDCGTPAAFWLLKLLSKFPIENAHPILEKYSSDPSADVRAAACECLGRSGYGESRDTALKCLRACLRDEVWYVRLQAVRGLSRMCGTACLPQLAALMAVERSTLVQESIKNVVIGDKEGVLATIETCLDADSQMIKEWHVNALVDSNSVVTVLSQCLSGGPQERERALRILAKLIRSKIHFGLKETLDQFQSESRKRILGIIADTDRELAARLGPQTSGGL